MDASSRRDFLRTLGGLGLLAALGGTGAPRPARAEPWGEWPRHLRRPLVPEERQAKNVLELFLFGGISPWETFYVVEEPEYGRHTGEMWWTFQDGPESVSEVFRRCEPRAPLLTPFARDANGAMVQLGPFVHPLRRRRDITDRLRLHVVQHDQMPHETAIPLALTGFRLGSPKSSGVGTAVQRYMLGKAGRPTAEPFAYFIRPQGRVLSTRFHQGAAAGLHPSYAQPLVLQVAEGEEFVEGLRRKGLGTHASSSDDLLAYYSDEARRRLSWKGTAPVRARALDEHLFASQMLRRSNELVTVFDPALFRPEPVASCERPPRNSEPLLQLRLAVHLLTRPGSEVRHVTVVDQGLAPPFDNVGYDTHQDHVRDFGPNLLHTLEVLTSLVNRPGEKDPHKLDLEDTLVVVNTEFGRSPGPQGGTGRNHHPDAYVTLMFGGPVGPGQRGIVGAIGPDGRARNALRPVETRAATLAALGIWPFTPEGYALGDVVGGEGGEERAARRLTETVLGQPS